MKKQLLFPALFLLLVSAFSISSCTKEPVTVKYGLSEVEVCLPADPYQAYHELTHVVQQSEIKAAVEAAGGKWDVSLIKKATMNNFKAVVTTNGVNLNDIATVEVYIKDDNTTGNGTQVAYSENIGDGATETTLKLNGTDLKEFLSKDHFTLLIRILNKENGNAPVCVTVKEGTMDLEVSSK